MSTSTRQATASKTNPMADSQERLLLAKLLHLALQVNNLEERVFSLMRQHHLPPEKGTDLIVKRDPSGWRGSSFVGRRYSECPVGYLRDLVTAQHAFAKRSEGEGRYGLATRARGAARCAEAWARWQVHQDEASSARPSR